MSIKITPNTMTCSTSGRSARRDDEGAWRVDYLPGRTFTHDEAITALSIAEAATAIDKAAATETGGATWDRLWPHICTWADELGVSPTEAFGAALSGLDDDEKILSLIPMVMGGPQTNVWTVDAAEGTAIGLEVPVIGDGTVLAVLRPFWSDEDGVHVQLDWEASPADMTAAQALTLADALRSVASIDGPEA